MNNSNKKQLERDRIIERRDIEGLFKIPENDFFSVTLHEILNKKCEFNPINLNPTERVLFLCINLENAGQSDGILTFLQEWYPQYATEAVYALNEIGATTSAEIIKQAIELLPKDGSQFFSMKDEEKEKLMMKLDRDFSNYPDGFLCDLFRKYAERHRKDFD
jgi:hypothetical protein